MAGKLTLVSTPIGNLQDMSFRSVEALKEADYILCEDTRHSIKLLNHFEISKKLVSYHEHNQYTKAESIMVDLRDGKLVALVTDAGTPGISDPGSHLVVLCQEEGIDYTIIPGPVAFVNALVLSGQNTNRLVFEGFLPMKKKERQKRFDILKNEMRTMVFYEAPHKLKNTISDMAKVFGGDRSISFVRELTKLHEEVLRMTFDEAIEYYETNQPKGEYVLCVEGISEDVIDQAKQEALAEVTMDEQMEEYLAQGMSKKDAIKQIAKDRNMPKREVYSYFTNE